MIEGLAPDMPLRRGSSMTSKLFANCTQVNRLILSKIVTRMGLLVDEAADGAEAVALVSRSLHTRPYAFVLLVRDPA